MNKEYEEIKVEKKDNGLKEKIYTHPAFGMISFSRITGGNPVMFGSSVNHNDRIAMRIKHGEEHRTLSEDWYIGRELITEVEMSYSQFVEAINTMNVRDGVPCTLKFTEKNGNIPMIKEINSKREQFLEEFSETIGQFTKQIQEQISIIQKSLDTKKTLGIKERQKMIEQLEMTKSNIGNNLDFCARQFNEQMDKTVMEAKGEIEAFCQNKVNSIAQAALIEHKEELMKLEIPVDYKY